MAMKHSTPNLSLLPKVDMLAFVASVIHEERSLLDSTPEGVAMNDTKVIWNRIKYSVTGRFVTKPFRIIPFRNQKNTSLLGVTELLLFCT